MHSWCDGPGCLVPSDLRSLGLGGPGRHATAKKLAAALFPLTSGQSGLGVPRSLLLSIPLLLVARPLSGVANDFQIHVIRLPRFLMHFGLSSLDLLQRREVVTGIKSSICSCFIFVWLWALRLWLHCDARLTGCDPTTFIQSSGWVCSGGPRGQGVTDRLRATGAWHAPQTKSISCAFDLLILRCGGLLICDAGNAGDLHGQGRSCHGAEGGQILRRHMHENLHSHLGSIIQSGVSRGTSGGVT